MVRQEQPQDLIILLISGSYQPNRETQSIIAESFNSPEELATYATESTAVFLTVGSIEECKSLTDEVSKVVNGTEKVVHVSDDAKIFEQMECPRELPALGAWSAKGALIGFMESDESVAEFIEYVRRFT